MSFENTLDRVCLPETRLHPRSNTNGILDGIVGRWPSYGDGARDDDLLLAALGAARGLPARAELARVAEALRRRKARRRQRPGCTNSQLCAIVPSLQLRFSSISDLDLGQFQRTRAQCVSA